MDRGAWWAIQSMGSHRVGHNWATPTIVCCFWEDPRVGAPALSILGKLLSLGSWGGQKGHWPSPASLQSTGGLARQPCRAWCPGFWMASAQGELSLPVLPEPRGAELSRGRKVPGEQIFWEEPRNSCRCPFGGVARCGSGHTSLARPSPLLSGLAVCPDYQELVSRCCLGFLFPIKSLWELCSDIFLAPKETHIPMSGPPAPIPRKKPELGLVPHEP